MNPDWLKIIFGVPATVLSWLALKKVAMPAIKRFWLWLHLVRRLAGQLGDREGVIETLEADIYTLEQTLGSKMAVLKHTEGRWERASEVRAEWESKARACWNTVETQKDRCRRCDGSHLCQFERPWL